MYPKPLTGPLTNVKKMFLVLDHTLALFAICNVMLVLDRSHRERGLRQESAVVCLLKFAGWNAAGGMDVCL
jgi:hypothetical protein